MCDYGGDDESDVWVWEWIRARKDRQCCACEETIRAGDVYHSYKSLYDGTWTRFVHCARCWSICEALWERNDGECIDLELGCGDVWENPPEEIAALAFYPEDQRKRAEDEYRRHKRLVMP